VVVAAVRVPLAEMAAETRILEMRVTGVMALHGRTECFMQVAAGGLRELVGVVVLPAAEVWGVVVAQRLTARRILVVALAGILHQVCPIETAALES
jgi:hypothetical protein